MAEAQHFPRLLHSDDADRVLASWHAQAPTGRWEDTYRVLARDGAVRWFHARGRRVTAPGEDPEIWHGVTLDVTHHHAEAASTANEADAEALP